LINGRKKLKDKKGSKEELYANLLGLSKEQILGAIAKGVI
jgi:hypothetical protein